MTPASGNAPSKDDEKARREYWKRGRCDGQDGGDGIQVEEHVTALHEKQNREQTGDGHPAVPSREELPSIESGAHPLQSPGKPVAILLAAVRQPNSRAVSNGTGRHAGLEQLPLACRGIGKALPVGGRWTRQGIGGSPRKPEVPNGATGLTPLRRRWHGGCRNVMAEWIRGSGDTRPPVSAHRGGWPKTPPAQTTWDSHSRWSRMTFESSPPGRLVASRTRTGQEGSHEGVRDPRTGQQRGDKRRAGYHLQAPNEFHVIDLVFT